MDAKEEAAEIRQEFARVRSSTGKPIFPMPMRARAVAYYTAQIRSGRGSEELCSELGIGSNSMRRWIADAPVVPARKGRIAPGSFVPVTVASPTEATTLRVLGPAGLRIEGLDLGALTELLRRLA